MYTTCDLLKDQVKKPEVNLESVDFIEINFTGLTLQSNLSVKNKISVDIPFPKIDFDLHILDIDSSFVTGTIESEGTLKTNESTIVHVPTKFTYENLFKLVAALTDENKKENPMYKIDMTAYIPVPGVGEFEFPFYHNGKIPIARKPDISVASKPKASIDYSSGLIPIPTGGKIEFSLNLKNNSNVAVLLKDLSYDLIIGGTSLKGGVDGKPNIDKGTTTKINFTLPLTVKDITTIGASVLTGNISDFSLTGNYELSLPEFPFLKELGDSFTLE
jgi:hypothetical protein